MYVFSKIDENHATQTSLSNSGFQSFTSQPQIVFLDIHFLINTFLIEAYVIFNWMLTIFLVISSTYSFK